MDPKHISFTVRGSWRKGRTEPGVENASILGGLGCVRLRDRIYPEETAKRRRVQQKEVMDVAYRRMETKLE